MKIIKTLATTASCTGPDSCPTIYLTDHHTLLIQGNEITAPFADHGITVPAGERLVEIPASLISAAETAFYSHQLGLDTPVDNLPHFTCPDCGNTSYHPQDVRNQYCGACHTFPEGRQP